MTDTQEVALPTAEPARMLSPLQQAVLDWVVQSTGSLLLVARAGCGKTTTIMELVKFLVSHTAASISIFVGAFNRPIADELTARLEAAGLPWRNAQANTWHGAGLAGWRKFMGWSPTEASRHIDDKKLGILLDEEMKTEEQKMKLEPYRKLILDLVSLAKQRVFGVLCAVEDQSKWFDIIDHFGMDEDLPEDADLDFVVRVAVWLYKRSLARCREIIDYDDMILAPLFFKVKLWQYDWVMGDESQDFNPARRALAMKLMKPRTGRLVAVGDDRQAIYGFTGADIDSMDLVRSAVNAHTLPLNVTYRCPKVVVRRAQQYVPDFEAHPSAPEGVERTIWLMPAQEGCPKRPTIKEEHFTADDVILCRNTKPLVEVAYDLLRRGVPCRIEGRNIADGLVALINRWKATGTAALAKRLVEYRDWEVQKWMAKGKEQKAEEISDKVETLLVMINQLTVDGKTKVSELVSFIVGMFGDTPQGQKPRCLTLSTVHKAKGREWPRVYLLGADKYMPSKWARKEWQLQQEYNLCYVALTRAQREIIDVVVE